MSSAIIQLGPWQLGTAAALVLALSGLTWYMRLALSGKLLIAAMRTVIQLLLLGLILEYLFATSHPALIALVALVMLLVAGHSKVGGDMAWAQPRCLSPRSRSCCSP